MVGTIARPPRQQRGGRFDHLRGKKGPDGRPFCRNCGGSVPAPKRTFCCNDCIHEHELRTQPNYARLHVYKRDRGVCASCGLNTDLARIVLRELELLCHDQIDGIREYRKIGPFCSRECPCLCGAMCRVLGLTPPVMDRHYWEMDHVVSVADGGGSCGLDNLQTLCVLCHKEKTRQLAHRKEIERRKRKGAAS